MIKFLVTICLMLLLYTGNAGAMPAIMTTDELKPGMIGHAETVVQGSQMVDFDVEIIGVVNNGKGSSKQILARAYGPVIDSTNGVIHGMSGSPVYIDGKLVGAVARGVGEDVLPFKFYITPAQDMLDIWKLPDPMELVNKSAITPVKIDTLEEYLKRQANEEAELNKTVEKYKSKHINTDKDENKQKGKARQRLEEILKEMGGQTQEAKSSEVINNDNKNSNETVAEKLSEHISLTDFILKSLQKKDKAQATGFVTENSIPVYVSGFSGNSLSFLAEQLKFKNMTPYASDAYVGSPEEDEQSDIKPNATLKAGDPMGVVMAYGDFSAGATGTVTAVDGNKVLGFGHAMTYKGNVNYFLTDANVIGSAGGLLNGVKVATFGKIIGRINQDRFNGVSGILNQYPASVPVRVNVIDENLGRNTNFSSKIAYDEDLIPSLASSIVYASMDRTADRTMFGSAKVKFSILTDAVPNGKFERENMFYDPKDVGQFTVGELMQALYFLSTNMDKPSTILDVKVDVDLTSNRNTASIVSAIPDKEEAKPGDTVTFSVTLKPYRKDNVIVKIPYTIPKTQKEGQMLLEVKGGGFVQLSQILQSGLVVTPQDIAQLSTADRLNDLQNLNKNNEIVISPTIDIQSDEDQNKAIEEAVKLSDEISKMTPKEREEFNKNRESKYTTDYVIDNFIQTSIKIKK